MVAPPQMPRDGMRMLVRSVLAVAEGPQLDRRLQRPIFTRFGRQRLHRKRNPIHPAMILDAIVIEMPWATPEDDESVAALMEGALSLGRLGAS